MEIVENTRKIQKIGNIRFEAIYTIMKQCFGRTGRTKHWQMPR